MDTYVLLVLACRDLAKTSSDCDEVMLTLNNKRAHFLADMPAGSHGMLAEISHLETYLSNLNFKQGLGFTIGGWFVINTQILTALFGKVN